MIEQQRRHASTEEKVASIGTTLLNQSGFSLSWNLLT